MKKDKKALIAYAAGIIDGEGCITISIKSNKKKHPTYNPSYVPRIVVGNLNGHILDLMFGLFGGSIRTRCNKYENGYLTEMVWEISSEKASRTAQQVYPFLRSKRTQAEILIRLQNRIKVEYRKLLKSGYKKGYHPRLSQHEIEERHNLYLKIKEANKAKIVCPRAGATTKQIMRLKEFFGPEHRSKEFKKTFVIASDSLNSREK